MFRAREPPPVATRRMPTWCGMAIARRQVLSTLSWGWIPMAVQDARCKWVNGITVSITGATHAAAVMPAVPTLGEAVARQAPLLKGTAWHMETADRPLRGHFSIWPWVKYKRGQHMVPAPQAKGGL